MEEEIIYCNVDAGGLPNNSKKLRAAFKEFAGQKVKVSICKGKKRSNNQNSYYFGVIIDRFLIGYEETEGRKLCMEFVNRKTGEILYIPLSKKGQVEAAHETLKTLFNEGKTTTQNSTTEQELYHELCREYIKFCYNIETPLPETQGDLHLKN